MPPNSAAMELKVLISILQSGTALQTMVNQVNQLSQALSKLQQQQQTGPSGPAIPPIPTTPIPPGGLATVPKQADAATAAMLNLEKSINKVIDAVKFMAGGFLALQSIRFLRRLADEAAQVEVLTTVLHVVANNAGYTAEEIDKVDKNIQKLGITAASAKQSLTSFLQARLKLEYAAPLARAAQDLAVISGMNSSDTLRRLVVNIQQLDALGLRWMGIVVDRKAAEEKFKEQIGATSRELTKREQQEALMVEVLLKAKQLEGAYATAMGDVAKQLTSLDRLTETYRATLGESLLPAYSAVVRIVTTTLEKLILLAKEFSANKERAQEWKDMATALANTVSTIILTIAEHIDQILVLTRIYLEFRAAIWLVNTAGRGLLWITQVIDWVTKARLAWSALSAGTISYRVALEAVGATSVKEAARIIMVGKANQAVALSQTQVGATAPLAVGGIAATGAAAATTTTFVQGLAVAWNILVATLAIPAIGYTIYKTVTEYQDEREKSVIQRASEALERGGESGSKGYEALFNEWRRGLGDTKKNVYELRAEFNKLVMDFKTEKVELGIADEIGKARADLTRLMTEREELFQKGRKTPGGQPIPDVTPIERKAKEAEVDKAAKRLEALQKDLDKYIEKTYGALAPSTKEIFKQVDLVDRLGAEYDRIRDSPISNTLQVSLAREEWEAQKKILTVMQAKHDERLKEDVTLNEEQRRVNKAAAAFKSRQQALQDQAEALRTGTEEMFGEKFRFTPEGVTSGQFAKTIGGFQKVLIEAETLLADVGEIPPQVAERIEKGLTSLGQAASTPVDLSKLQKTLEDVEKLRVREEAAVRTRIPTDPKAAVTLGETRRLGRQAEELAREGVREARLGIAAPLVSVRQAEITRQTDEAIEEARRKLEGLKAIGVKETETMEDLYRQGLVNLEDYYDKRIDTVITEGEQELNVQAEQIAKMQALQADPDEDPRKKAERAIQIQAAVNQATQIADRTANEVFKLNIQRQQRQRDLNKEIRRGLVEQTAEFGGQEEALAQLNLQLEEEERKYAELDSAAAERLRILKQLSGEAEIYRKARERVLQIEMEIEGAFQRQLDARQQRRDTEAARDQLAQMRGTISGQEAMERANTRLEESMRDNRERRASEERKLADQRLERDRAFVKLDQDLRAAQTAPAERAKRLIESTQKWATAIDQTTTSIQGLDTAYLEMAVNVQTHSKQIYESLVRGFTNAVSQTITDFKKAGEVWMNLAQSISAQIVSIFVEAFARRLFKQSIFNWVDSFMSRIFGEGGGGGSKWVGAGLGLPFAEGGMVQGPGTGTSDSVPAMLSAGEHVMPAAKAAKYLPLLEGIRLGTLTPAFALGGTVGLQSIAITPVIPRHYAAGGVVVADAGAAAVQTGGNGGPGNMVVSMHPETLNMTMREWLEHEVVRQHGRR